MIISKILGGLGNQMFQYAVGRSLSERLGVEFKLDTHSFEVHEFRGYGLCNFKIKEVFATKEEVKEITRKDSDVSLFSKLFKKKNKYGPFLIQEKPLFVFNKRFLSLTDNVLLNGYWQNEKYFENIRDTLIEDFVLKEPMSDKSIELKKEIASSQSVSLHIRRGDYAHNEKVNRQYGLCSLEYYKRAVDYLEKEVGGDLKFFIFSDEPQWAKENLEINYPLVVVDHNGRDKDFEDMMLMSACKHQIIANSTFSWWGAWLNENKEKIVVTPEKWFLAKKYDTSELIPKNWIRI